MYYVTITYVRLHLGERSGGVKKTSVTTTVPTKRYELEEEGYATPVYGPATAGVWPEVTAGTWREGSGWNRRMTLDSMSSCSDSSSSSRQRITQREAQWWCR